MAPEALFIMLSHVVGFGMGSAQASPAGGVPFQSKIYSGIFLNYANALGQNASDSSLSRNDKPCLLNNPSLRPTWYLEMSKWAGWYTNATHSGEYIKLMKQTSRRLETHSQKHRIPKWPQRKPAEYIRCYLLVQCKTFSLCM